LQQHLPRNELIEINQADRKLNRKTPHQDKQLLPMSSRRIKLNVIMLFSETKIKTGVNGEYWGRQIHYEKP
jgi:hypothetical protein